MVETLKEFPSKEEFIEAYKKTALEPVDHRTYRPATLVGKNACGCPMAALYLAAHPEGFEEAPPSYSDQVFSWAHDLYGRYATSAFVQTFDGEQRKELDIPMDDKNVMKAIEVAEQLRKELIKC